MAKLASNDVAWCFDTSNFNALGAASWLARGLQAGLDAILRNNSGNCMRNDYAWMTSGGPDISAQRARLLRTDLEKADRFER